MTKTKTLIYLALWVAYVVFSYTGFPHHGSDIAIPSMVLVALGAWYFGTFGGLTIVLVSMPYHYYLLDHYGDILATYQSKAFGICFQTITAILFGSLKRFRTKEEELAVELDKAVADRTRELDRLLDKLLIDDETIRRRLGRDIHDGLGQHLTALTLYSSSLQTALQNKDSPSAQLSSELVVDAQRTLHLARKISRTLSPFIMEQTGLSAALDELTSYFTETTDVTFSTSLDGSEVRLSNIEVLHLYRIAYICILNALQHASPTHMCINLISDHAECYLIIENDGGDAYENTADDMGIELMRYRARQIHGELTIDTTHSTKSTVSCKFPFNQICKGSRGKGAAYA